MTEECQECFCSVPDDRWLCDACQKLTDEGMRCTFCEKFCMDYEYYEMEPGKDDIIKCKGCQIAEQDSRDHEQDWLNSRGVK